MNDYYEDISSWICGVGIDDGEDILPIEVIKAFGRYNGGSKEFFTAMFNSFIRTGHLEMIDDKHVKRLPSINWQRDETNELNRNMFK